ncbi:MAG: hypothetical protein ACFFA0_05605 [Promethearchaeota archaeon]
MNEFRNVNEFEKSIIVDSLNSIFQNPEKILKKIQNNLYISFEQTFSGNNYPSIYLLFSDQRKYIDKFEANTFITSVGLYFGFIKKENFYISIEGVEFLVINEDFSLKKILVIDGKGEKSILYGNDIKKEEVLKFPTILKKGDILVIYNSKNEICAIAQSIINKNDLPRLNPNDNIALNLVDKGYYLRTKQ